MTRRAAVHTFLLTIGAFYLSLVLGAPFCALSRPNHHAGHGMDRRSSACGWSHSVCDSTLLPSPESGKTILHSTPVLFMADRAAVSEFDFQAHPARSPPVSLS